jgi:hypothetical protein
MSAATIDPVPLTPDDFVIDEPKRLLTFLRETPQRDRIFDAVTDVPTTPADLVPRVVDPSFSSMITVAQHLKALWRCGRICRGLLRDAPGNKTYHYWRPAHAATATEQP